MPRSSSNPTSFSPSSSIPTSSGPTPPPHSLAYLFPIIFFAGTILISLGPVLDPIIRDLNIPLAQGGLLAAGFAMGRVAALLVLNIFLGGVPLKWLVVGAAALQALGLGVPALLVHSLGPLVGSLAVVGAAATIPIVAPMIWIGSYAKGNTKRATLLVLVFFSLGVVVAPLAIGVALALGAGWRWVFLAEAAFSVVVSIAVAVLPLADVPGRENIRWRQLREAVAFAPGLLALILFTMFLYIGAEHILNIWLAEFQVEAFGAGQGTAAVSVSVFFAGIMVGRFFAVPLVQRLAASRLIAVSCGLMAVFILMTALAPVFAVSEVGVFLTGLGGSAAYPILTSYTYRFPEKYSGLVFSIITLVVIISGAVFAYAVGPAAEALGMRAALALAAVPAVGVVILSFFLPEEPGTG